MAAALTAAVALAACSSAESADPSVGPPVATVDRDTIAAATVSIESDGCGPRVRSGRGTVIDDGLILTAAHTVAGAETVEVALGGPGEGVPATVVFLDADVDVAALRVEEATPPPVELSDGVVDGDVPAVVAFPADDDSWEVRDVEVGDPLVIRTTDIYRNRDVERPGFKVATDVDEGDSGSMVHQADGGVGVIWARSNLEPDQAWAVAIPELFTDAAARSALVDAVDSGACP